MNRQLTVSVGLIEYEEKILLTRRYDPKHPQWHHRWQFPGGKIAPQETPLDAVHREIFEETNLLIHHPRLLGVYTQHWQKTDETQQTFILLYHCFTDHPNVILKTDENDDYVWKNPQEIFKMENLLENVVPMLKELYRIT